MILQLLTIKKEKILAEVLEFTLIRIVMHKDKFVFAQLVSFLDRNKFNYIVRKHVGDKYVKHFVYAFDSTSIDWFLALFWWAKFREKKNGIKVHTLYDVEIQTLTFFHITQATVHDSKVMKEISYELESYYIFDRAYNMPTGFSD